MQMLFVILSVALLHCCSIAHEVAHPAYVDSSKTFEVASAVSVDSATLEKELLELAHFSDTDFPAVTRIIFSESDLKARAFVKQVMVEAGLNVSEDAMGNIFGRWEGSNLLLTPVASGSHTDAIPVSGMYDGTVGVLGAIEAVRALKRSGFQPVRSIEVVMFTSEEPTRFGLGCIGSRVLSGALPVDRLFHLADKHALTFHAARAAANLTLPYHHLPMLNGRFHSFVELHIEQGPLLERAGVPVGIVTAIAAPATLRVVFEGDGGHAGSLLMADRHDPFLAAAELALEVERAAVGTGAIDTVATTGLVNVIPNAVNSVPTRTTLEIDVRDIDQGRRDEVVNRVIAAARAIAERRGVRLVDLDVLNADPPATSAPQVLQAITNATRAARVAAMEMVSRAYHDALFMARIAPTAMIFIPCRNGVSHTPDEYASREAISTGVQVLALTLANLASAPLPPHQPQ